MNFSQIKTLVSNLVGDLNLTRYTSTQYQDAINRAQEQFAYDSRALFKDAATITTVDGTAAYNLPADFWLEKMVTHKGLMLNPVTRYQLLKNNGDDWTDDAGTPTRFLIDPEEGRKQLRLYPIPQAGDAGANLILTYYPVPASISVDTDTPLNSSALMVQFHMGIAAYAAWLMLLYEQITPEMQAKRQELLTLYNAKTIDAVDYFGNTASAPWIIQGGFRWK